MKVKLKIILLIGLSIGITIVIFGFIYLAMFLDTDKVIKKMEQHIKGEIPVSEEIKHALDKADDLEPTDPERFFNKPDGMLYFLNFNYHAKKHYSAEIYGKIECNIKRKFVLHNFKDGFIQINRSIIYYDKNGKVLNYYEPTNLELRIHKENGEWYVMGLRNIWPYNY